MNKEALKIRKKRMEIERDVVKCKECNLINQSINQDAKVLGNGCTFKPFYFLIGIAPSHKRVVYPNRAFHSTWGILFRGMLNKIGLYSKCYITNLLKCSTPGNRKTKSKERKMCFKYFLKELNLFRPKILIAMGKEVQEHFKISTHEFKKKRIGNETFLICGIHHPSYCFNYNRISIFEYANSFQEIMDFEEGARRDNG